MNHQPMRILTSRSAEKPRGPRPHPTPPQPTATNGVEELIDDLNAVLWEADPRTFQFTYVSHGAERLLGYPRSQWVDETDFWARHIHLDDRAEAITHCLVATREGRDHDFQYRMIAADGTVRWVRDIVRVRSDETGQVIRLSGLLLDVTDHRLEVEATLAQATRDGVVEPPTVRILILDDNPDDASLAAREVRKTVPDCTIMAVQNGGDYDRALWEFVPDLILSDHAIPGFGGRDALRLARARRPWAPFILLTGSLDEETAVEYMKAGAADYLLKGRTTRLGVSVLAALDQKRQREDRARAEAQYRDIFLGAPVGIARTTPDGQLLTANPELARMLGYDDSLDLATLNIARDVYLHETDREQVIAAVRNSATVTELEVQWKKKDGNTIWVQLSVQAARETTGAVRYLEVFVRDVSEQKLLAAQLRQAQRMEAIGQLAGGVAHDFNNILMAVLGCADLLLEDLGPTDARREDVQEIRKAAERGAGLTRQLLAFSRKQVLAIQSVDVNAVVQNVERMLQRLVGESVALQLTLAADLGTVRADPGQVEQVIMNLVVNARDAIAPSYPGLISIETANEDLDAGYSGLHVGVEPGPYVMLAVTDSGVGMDAEVKARVFEPFFTTKAPGKGTGLGLSTVYGIVQQSGGHIWVYSEPGLGTTVKVYLPRVDEPAELLATAPVSEQPSRGNETILLVEDEDAVRAVASRVLAAAGYTVLAAANGNEGLALALAHAGPISLLLTDVVMPGMNGPEVASRLEVERPGIRILYMSGYPSGMLPEPARGVRTEYLPKPFSPHALQRKVREILDAGSGRQGFTAP